MLLDYELADGDAVVAGHTHVVGTGGVAAEVDDVLAGLHRGAGDLAGLRPFFCFFLCKNVSSYFRPRHLAVTANILVRTVPERGLKKGMCIHRVSLLHLPFYFLLFFFIFFYSSLFFSECKFT